MSADILFFCTREREEESWLGLPAPADEEKQFYLIYIYVSKFDIRMCIRAAVLSLDEPRPFFLPACTMNDMHAHTAAGRICTSILSHCEPCRISSETRISFC